MKQGYTLPLQCAEVAVCNSIFHLSFTNIEVFNEQSSQRNVMLSTGLFETFRRGETRGFCANTTGSYGFLKILKIYHTLYNDVHTRVSHSLSLSLSLSHTHTMTNIC
jgi:hypothetical protein